MAVDCSDILVDCFDSLDRLTVFADSSRIWQAFMIAAVSCFDKYCTETVVAGVAEIDIHDLVFSAVAENMKSVVNNDSYALIIDTFVYQVTPEIDCSQ